VRPPPPLPHWLLLPHASGGSEARAGGGSEAGSGGAASSLAGFSSRGTPAPSLAPSAAQASPAPAAGDGHPPEAGGGAVRSRELLDGGTDVRDGPR
jgi:hypothetical protein